jgi:hypothetical protein
VGEATVQQIVTSNNQKWFPCKGRALAVYNDGIPFCKENEKEGGLSEDG